MSKSDGIVVNHLESGGWQYRVWDAAVRRYRTRTFHRGDEDAQRRRDGTAAGDRWADEQGSRFSLGQDSAATVTIATLGDYYREHRATQGDSQSNLNAIGNATRIAVEGGITDLSHPAVAARLQRILAKHMACRPGQRTPTPATPRTKNAQIAIYKAMSAWAIRRRILGKDPFLGLETFKEVKEHREVYTIAELREMLDDRHRADPWFPFVILAALTGARSETLRSLTWGMVDFTGRRIRIPGAILKADVAGAVPLQPELAEWLQGIGPGLPRATILPASIAGLNSDQTNERMRAFLNRIGIEARGRSVHCLRHSMAGLLTATDMSAFGVMDALCHRNIATSKHYATMADAYREQVKREGWPSGEVVLRRSVADNVVGK